jgi:hypothetical protein
MSCYPNSGQIQPYSQISITFKCRAKMLKDFELFANEFAIADADDQIIESPKQETKPYHYVASFHFDQKKEPLMIEIKA